MVWIWVSIGCCVWIVGSQIIALFWEVLDSFRGQALIEELVTGMGRPSLMCLGLNLFWRSWCMEREYSVFSKTRTMLGGTSNSQGQGQGQGPWNYSFLSWAPSSSNSRRQWSSVPRPLHAPFLMSLRYPVFLFCNIVWLVSHWLYPPIRQFLMILSRCQFQERCI